jgi:hypothetical protein
MDAPRKLTKAEIDNLLNSLPPIAAISNEISQPITQSMKETIRSRLSNITLSPSKLPRYSQTMVRDFYRSRVQAGTMVGLRAGEAFGQPFMQSTLNTFHKAGSVDAVVAGPEQIKEIIDASKHPKKQFCQVIFKDKNLTFAQVAIDMRKRLTGITFRDIVSKVEIERYGFINANPPWWYPVIQKLYQDEFQGVSLADINPNNYMIRLYFPPQKLLVYGLTTTDIANVLTTGGKKTSFRASRVLMELDPEKRPLLVLPSPTIQGVVDIISMLPNDSPPEERNNVRLILNSIITKHLDTWNIQGVKGINEVVPMYIPVWNLVQVMNQLNNNRWELLIDDNIRAMYGLPVERLINLIEFLGMRVEKSTPERVVVISPKNPEKVLAERVKEEEKIDRPGRETQLGTIELPVIENVRRYVYARTDGSNLKALLALPLVDSQHTTSNNVHEMIRAFGVETVRNFMIQEIIHILANNNSVLDHRHVTLIVDRITYQGFLTSITGSTLERENIGPLAKAGIKRQTKPIVKESLMGVREPSTAVTTSIMLGQRGQFGAGILDYSPDTEAIAEYGAEVEEEVVEDFPADIADTIDLELPDFTAEDLASQLEGLSVSTDLSSNLITEVGEVSSQRQDQYFISDQQALSNMLEEAADTFETLPCLPPHPDTVTVSSAGSTFVQSQPALDDAGEHGTFDLPDISLIGGGPPEIAQDIDEAQEEQGHSVPLADVERFMEEMGLEDD